MSWGCAVKIAVLLEGDVQTAEACEAWTVALGSTI